jgi:uncharacterized protein YdaU (DUF1376 family)
MAGRFAFMAKDPALLFYTSDFLSGTMLLSMEQRGKYITLLCLQHQTGRLSEKHMLQICGTHDPDIWAKFKQDEAGLFYNERLEMETERRRNYSESRSKNRKGKKKDVNNTSKTYDVHMETETETITESKKEKRSRFQKPTLQDVEAYAFERGYNKTFAARFYDGNEAKGWKVGKSKMEDWKAAMRTWEKSEWNDQYRINQLKNNPRVITADTEL